jgi:outer membrane biosynthesis protein TonB
VSAPLLSENDPRFVFDWDRPGRRKWTIAGFLFGSLLLHAFCFYMFQIIYPPAVALLPPPGRVSLIAPNSEEGRVLLRWLEAEDPALASTTQRPTDGKPLPLPTIQHAPSYLTREPALKEIPAAPSDLRLPSAQPPAAVERPRPQTASAPKIVSTTLRFSPELEALGTVQSPELKFTASGHESPEVAQFRIAVNELGEVRSCFLEKSSGDAALDDQARKYLTLCRFPAILHPPSSILAALTWGLVTVEWGNDIVRPPSTRTESIAP